MGNKYSQTEEARNLYLKRVDPLFIYMVDKSYYQPKHIFTKEELCDQLNLSERAVRKSLEKMANYYPVISFSNKKGYRYGVFNDNTKIEDLEELLDDTEHAIAELQSRIESLQARMKPLIALKVKVSERIDQFGVIR